MIKSSISCHIFNNVLLVNGQQDFVQPDTGTEGFMKALYHHLKIDYLKFFKMDGLARLGFLATEVLITYYPTIKQYNDDEVALVFANRVSSRDTDQRFWKGVSAPEAMASPALFVYTLPNIVQGEIAIRNKWFGENIFLVREKYDPMVLKQTAEIILNAGKARACITGWVDYLEGSYEAIFEVLEINNEE
jgi:hypothetical protein